MSKLKSQKSKQPKIDPVPKSLREARPSVKYDPEVLKEEEPEIEIPDLENVRALFDQVDTKKTEAISFDQSKKLFTLLNYDKTEHNQAKTDFNNLIEEREVKTITFDDFLFLYRKILKVRKQDEEAKSLIKAFKMFDLDGNGSISNAEMKYILLKYDNNFTDEELDEIFNEADLNHDGQLDYNEFVQFWKENSF